jgi:hypothetical protein
MTEEELISQDCKKTFSTPEGKRVLDYLKLRCCFGGWNQTCYDPVSDRKTNLNLGAHAVYKHIMYLIEKELGKAKITDCITQTERTDL